MTTDRLDWTIEQKNLWVATSHVHDIVLVGRTKSELMSKINRWEKAAE